MVIFSQDRKRIINFEQTQELEVNTPGTWDQDFYSIDTYPIGEGDNVHIRLGKYPTRERAMDILKDIAIFYEKSKEIENDTSPTKFYLEDAYMFIMPKE